MNELFLKIFNMSISASWLILAVVIFRLILKKAPKCIYVILWGIVAVKLICPFSIKSAFSLIPSAETIPINIEMDFKPAIDSGIPVINSVVNPVINQTFAPAKGGSVNPLQILISIFAFIWIIGMAILFVYSAFSYLRLKRKIDTAVLYQDNIFQSENVSSPFVLGIITPKIYIPFQIKEQNLKYIIAHEKAHIKRKDNLWKPLGFILLTIHWFNPLVWLSYMLLCRDIELACDEKVIKSLDNEQKADYTQALVSYSINRHLITACPLSFGEIGVKKRVKSIMKYKKPSFWIITVSIIALIIFGVCFLTNPKTSQQSQNLDLSKASEVETLPTIIDEYDTEITADDILNLAVKNAIIDNNKSYDTKDLISCASFITLQQSNLAIDSAPAQPNQVILYGMAMYQEFKLDNNQLKEVGGLHCPVVLTFEETGDNYKLLEYWQPRDGSYYEQDIRDKFPDEVEDYAMDTQRYVAQQTQKCYDQAVVYLKNTINDNSNIGIVLYDDDRLGGKASVVSTDFTATDGSGNTISVWYDNQESSSVKVTLYKYGWFGMKDVVLEFDVAGNDDERKEYIASKASRYYVNISSNDGGNVTGHLQVNQIYT